MTRLDALDAADEGFDTLAGCWGCCSLDGRSGVQLTRDGMDPVEGAGQDEIVVAIEGLQAWVEGAGVDQPAGFVDDEKGEDGPTDVLVGWMKAKGMYESLHVQLGFGRDSCVMSTVDAQELLINREVTVAYFASNGICPASD